MAESLSKERNTWTPNLFQLNSGAHPETLRAAHLGLWLYIDFINKSIEYLKRETLSIKVIKTINEGEIRYSPVPPENKSDERANALLLSENTRYVFDQNMQFSIANAILIENQNEDTSVY